MGLDDRSIMLTKTKEPLILAKEGHADIVVMSKDVYEDKIVNLELYKKLEQSEKDIENGAEFSLDNVLAELGKKHGFE